MKFVTTTQPVSALQMFFIENQFFFTFIHFPILIFLKFSYFPIFIFLKFQLT